MKNQSNIDETKRAKNIAAVLYLLVLAFLVGGSYLNQRRGSDNATAITGVPADLRNN